jgi:cytochrome P450
LERAVAEVDAFGSKIPEFKDLSNFPFIEAVVNESLRLFPPVTGTIPRHTEEPIELAGYTIPAGCDVTVNVLHMQHNPSNFSDPELFKPQRFVKGDPEFEEHHPYAHMPFGGGARICIGMKFALEEVKLVLITVLQRFSIQLSPGQIPLKLGNGATLGPESGIFCKISARSSPL